ncbi:hypothetical protein WJX81_001837 [Elliptochloris bilobata]|uniref:Fumarylacetoacetase n=1 Tax=Elliptochloris bilobata TaxID=381761 RepID=A0AAW1SHC2_9CHLO
MALAQSFIAVEPDSHFPLQNLPYGVFSSRDNAVRRIGVALGNQVVDLCALSNAGLLRGQRCQWHDCFRQASLNSFMALGRPEWREARAVLMRLLDKNEGRLRDDTILRQRAIVPMEEVTMHLPAEVGDYTDFYASREHATACGEMFRGHENALNPNWLSLPVAYHGRSSSVVVSGTPIRRPRGQVLGPGGPPASLQACSVLDYELEMGCLIGPGNELGEPVGVAEARDHMFGLVLLNDWSARDVQRWEMVPLGPFASKNFATSISPWVVTFEALEPFRCDAPKQDPEVLPYLREAGRHSYDIQLEAAIEAQGGGGGTVTRSNFRHLYWTLEQMVAHHTAGGCNLRPGDLLGTGTLSSAATGGAACLLEASRNGANPVALAPGVERTFLCDGDAVCLSAHCQGNGFRVGFGECVGRVMPARAGQ